MNPNKPIVYSCELCESSFRVERSLIIHNVEEHDYPMECICGKTYSSRSKRHFLPHLEKCQILKFKRENESSFFKP